MPASTDIREGIAEAFNVLSDEFIQGVTVKLVKASDTYDEFDTVLEITSKRFFEYSNFRRNFLLEIADTSAELTAAIDEATHVQIDDDYFTIIDGPPLPPQSTDVTWKIFCDRYETTGHYTTAI